MNQDSKAKAREASRLRMIKRREKLEARGLKEINLTVPADVADEFTILASACRDNEDYYPAAVRDRTNGRMISLNNVQPKRGNNENSK